MSEQRIDLKKLERKVWTSFYEDGIWDIYLGLLLSAIAVGAFFTDTGLTEKYSIIGHSGVIVLAILVLLLGKRLITVPRMGTVVFGPRGRARLTKTQILLAISCVTGLAAFLLLASTMGNATARQPVMDYIIPIFWTVNMLVLFSLAAYFLNYRRLYIIGFLYAVAVPADKIMRQLLHIDLSVIAFGVPALAILIMGFVVLARFLKKYPKTHEEEQNVEI
ncbi:MAG: hypothetical protein JSW49_04910 [candidate division WOR-3 bacterium]|nr:MAG: hypothetical protein JSW49_04910 [candidate division WOR-3 bacterium]